MLIAFLGGLDIDTILVPCRLRRRASLRTLAYELTLKVSFMLS